MIDPNKIQVVLDGLEADGIVVRNGKMRGEIARASSGPSMCWHPTSPANSARLKQSSSASSGP
jgi:hypothetical protein